MIIRSQDVNDAQILKQNNELLKAGCLTKGICFGCMAQILSNSDVQKLVVTKMVKSLTSDEFGDMLQRMGISTEDDEAKMHLIKGLTKDVGDYQ